MIKSLSRKFKKIRFHMGITDYTKKEIPNLPNHIQIEPTVRCNLHCLTCSRSKVISQYKKADMDLSELNKLLAFLPDLKSVKLQGLGEPLLHPQIDQLLKLLKQNNVKVWTISNGTLFLQKKYRDMVVGYIDDIAVSFDSVNKQGFNYLRKGADMDKIIEGIRLLVNERDKSRSNVAIGINFVVSHKNYLELDKLCDLASNLRLDYITVGVVENWMIPGEDGYEESASFVAESRKCSPQIQKHIRKLRLSLLRRGILFGYKSYKKRKGCCHWPFNSMFISVEGFVSPCCIRMHNFHSFGNVFKEQSLESIWTSEQYITFRKSHINNKIPNSLCANCPD